MERKRSTRRRPSAGAGELTYQVFVSHATADKWIAKALCEKIETTGAVTFRDDRDIDGGDDIPDEIRKEINRSAEMVVLLTPDSATRPWVLFEVGAAWGRRQNYRITVVLCHASVNVVPDMIRSKKAISINDFDDFLRELRRRIGRHRK